MSCSSSETRRGRLPSPACSAAPTGRRESPIDPRQDLALLPYSSGTTGLPKGVMLTHANLVANVAQLAGSEPVSEADTLIGVLPFFHMYGLTVLINYGLAVGATVVTLPRFDLDQFLQTVETYGVTYAYLAPPIVLALARQPAVERYDLSRLRCIVAGGAPLSEEIAGTCSKRVGCHVKQGYGLTEASPVTHIGPADPARAKSASIGLLLPNTEGKVVDVTSGAELGPDQPGELWVRGPQVMKGYLNRPEATAAILDVDGWLRTGDLGYADAEGNFYVVDRIKELIKYKGFQVAPAELEAVLLSHPAVADVAVIPSPDEAAGEVPKAFVVARAETSAEELMAFVAARVAPYKKVRRAGVRRADSEVALRQDPAPRPGRARAGRGARWAESPALHRGRLTAGGPTAIMAARMLLPDRGRVATWTSEHPPTATPPCRCRARR